MRVSAKIALIDQIGRELQSRYRFDEIDIYLTEFGIAPPTNVGSNSKWVYSKAALQGVPDEKIIAIADDLALDHGGLQRGIITPPRNWQGTSKFRAFISHISHDKGKAKRLKDCLDPYAISGFVAHEDIHPTLEWQSEIERALCSMDVLIAVHTPGFRESFWTQQEIGFAVGRGTKIISLGMGEDPTGFISKHQALPRRNRTAEEIAQEIDAILTDDAATTQKLLEAKQRNGALPALDAEIPF